MQKQSYPPKEGQRVQKREAKRSPQRECRVLLCICYLFWAILLLLVALHAKPAPGSRAYVLPMENRSVTRALVTASPPPEGLVNVNTAGIEELCSIKYVGPSLAEKIIEEREKNGPFYYPEDLLNVNGIGEKTLEKMTGQFCLY